MTYERKFLGGGSGASGVPLAGSVLLKGQAPTFPTGRILTGAYCNLASQSGSQSASLSYREGQLGRKLDIGHHFYSFTDPNWPGSLEQGDIAAGRIPFVAWQGAATLNAVIGGSQDAVITAAAQRCAAFGYPMFLRWAWEMNGNWYTWSGPQNGSKPSLFIQAWQRVWNIFKANGASNVSWVWCPNVSSSPGGQTLTDANNWRWYYPGDQYVDVIATDVYNWGNYNAGANGTWSSLRSLLSVFAADVIGAGALGGRVQTAKPFMLAEFGCFPTPGLKGEWISDALGYLRGLGAAAVVAFDTDNSNPGQGGISSNWAMDSSTDALNAWKEWAQQPRNGGKSTGGGTYRNVVLGDSPYVYLPLNDTASPFTDIGSAGITTAQTESTHTALSLNIPGPTPSVPNGVGSTGGGGVSIGTIPTFGAAMGSGFTIECLFKYGATGVTLAAAQALLSVLNTGTVTELSIGLNSTSALAFSAGATVFRLRNEAGTTRLTTFSGAQALGIYDGNWHHLVWVCNPAATSDAIYVDGAAATATATPGSATGGTYADFGFPLTAFERNNRGAFDLQAVGAISNLAFYKSMLSAGAVTNHYAALTN